MSGILAQPPLPDSYFVSDRWRVATNQLIQNGEPVRFTGNIINAGNMNAMEVQRCTTAGQPSIGISLHFKPIVGNVAAANADYLMRELSIITHGPAKVINVGTGVIWPWEEVTTGGLGISTVIAPGVTMAGIMARTDEQTEAKLGVAMDYFTAFDTPGCVNAIWVDPAWRVEHI